MAAFKNVYQVSQSHNSPVPRHGVVTLFGYGIQVRVDRGHLLLEDGIGPDRRRFRLPRVGHGLKRLVVIGSDGLISLSALRWIADQKAAFVMLERDGSVLTTTGPVRSSDARLRRAQALSGHSGVAIEIARELIDKKLIGQEQVARHKLLVTETADRIAKQDGVGIVAAHFSKKREKWGTRRTSLLLRRLGQSLSPFIHQAQEFPQRQPLRLLQ
jgi:CRISPR associated protein Cas1